MKITPRPTSFECAWAQRPDGGRDLVVVMIVGGRSYIGTPSRDQARELRKRLGELLNTEAKGVDTTRARRTLIDRLPRSS